MLNTLQGYFVHWNAERLNISIDESLSRFEKSLQSVDGHDSRTFKSFSLGAYELYLPFHYDDENSVFESYQYHSNMHFLRQLAWPINTIEDNDLIFTQLSSNEQINMFDFGCGLSQLCLGYALKFKELGKKVTISLIDIPTLMFDFLKYVCHNLEIKTDFYEVPNNGEYFFPTIDKCQLGIVTEVFEHLYNPREYFKKINSSMDFDGFMITNIHDHEEGYMHVTPNLSELRKSFSDYGYKIIVDNKGQQVFRKAYE